MIKSILILLICLLCCNAISDNVKMDKLNDYTNIKIKQSKYYLLYYTASWCGACREFCPILKKFLNENKSITMILVSLDFKEKDFNKLIKKEDIKLYIKFKKAKQSKVFDVCGNVMPWLTLLDKDGEVLYKNMGNEKSLKRILKISKEE